MVTPHLPRKFHANRSSRFLIMLLTRNKEKKNKERNRPKTIPRPPTGDGVIIKKSKWVFFNFFSSLLSVYMLKRIYMWKIRTTAYYAALLPGDRTTDGILSVCPSCLSCAFSNWLRKEKLMKVAHFTCNLLTSFEVTKRHNTQIR